MPNFADRIAAAAARFPDRTAIELVRADAVETTTYAELMRRAEAYRAWLEREGIAPGDRIAILADNDAEWIAAYLGILQRPAVAVPLDTAYKPAQVCAVLENAGGVLLLTTAKYADVARAGAALMRPTPARVVERGESVFHNPAQASERRPAAEGPTPSAAVILYTSGTTADPKGVVLTHDNLEAERSAAFEIIHVTEDDAVLGVLPLFHALAQMANLLLPLAVGARVVFLETVSSASLVGALTSRRITIFACVPQFFYLIHQRVTAEMARKGGVIRRVLRGIIAVNVIARDRFGWNPGRRVFARVHRTLGPAMRLLITGGSKFDPAIARDLYGLGFTILNAYGLTETSGGATIQRPGDRFTTSVGQPFPGVEIKIARDSTSSPSSSREEDDGEILIRGPIVMREYFRRPDATAEAIRDGWLHTGDLGRLDADGRLYITGRLKEIIVLSSGKNLYPEEIEAHYRQSVYIKELCVLGLTRPDEPSAERLHAVIVPDSQVLADRGIVNVRELVRFELETLSVALPPHKRILSYDISLEPLPRTTTGKIKRHEVERQTRARATTSAASNAATRPLTPLERDWIAVPPRAEFVEAIAADTGTASIPPNANLELDLGLDSMERVELLTRLEHRAGTRVPADVRATIFTVRQLVEAVLAAPRSQAGQAADDVPEHAWDVQLATPADADIVENLRRSKLVTAVVLFVVVRIAAIFARVVWGFRIRGREHLPVSGAFILSPNHQTYVDGIFLTAGLPFRAFRRLFLVGAADFFAISSVRLRFARAINIVPVDPDANLITAMRAGATGLRMGKVLILFPEGERTIDGEVKKFRKGAAILSAHTAVPIVPVALDGLYPIWPRGRSLNWKRLLPGAGTKISLTFGPPLQAGKGNYEDDTAKLKSEVLKLLQNSRRS